jgi:hypothetical protein
MRQFAEHFQVVLFRSLRDAPSCEALLEECLQLLAPQSLEVHCLTKNLPRRFLDPRRISSPQLFHVSRNTPGTTNAKQLVPPRQKPTNGASWEECEQEHITFTRGRPYQKRDQCFVEQKNGAIVRQVVGYDRFAGEHAYRQQGSTTSTMSRRGENVSWAGGAPRKTLLQGSGSRSCPGYLPTLNGVAGTSSGSCSASLPDVINRCKSVLFFEQDIL